MRAAFARWMANIPGLDLNQTTNRNPQLDQAGAQWGDAFAGLTSLAAEAQRDPNMAPQIGSIDPFGHGPASAGQDWAIGSRDLNDQLMDIRIQYVNGPQQMAPRAQPQIGPYDMTEQRAAALQRALVADMLAAPQA